MFNNTKRTLGSLTKQLRAQREIVVDLGDGKSVTLLRPREAELSTFSSTPVPDAVSKAAVDWSGFSEASFLGEAVGNSDPLPFSPEVWDEAVRDKAEWLRRCIAALAESVTRHLDTMEIAAKN